VIGCRIRKFAALATCCVDVAMVRLALDGPIALARPLQRRLPTA
jgi:hypothetical protein